MPRCRCIRGRDMRRLVLRRGRLCRFHHGSSTRRAEVRSRASAGGFLEAAGGKLKRRGILATPHLHIAVGGDEQSPVAAVGAACRPHREVAIVLLVAGAVDPLAALAAVLDSAAEREAPVHLRSEEHTSELLSLMRSSYAVFCLKNK